MSSEFWHISNFTEYYIEIKEHVTKYTRRWVIVLNTEWNMCINLLILNVKIEVSHLNSDEVVIYCTYSIKQLTDFLVSFFL